MGYKAFVVGDKASQQSLRRRHAKNRFLFFEIRSSTGDRGKGAEASDLCRLSGI